MTDTRDPWQDYRRKRNALWLRVGIGVPVALLLTGAFSAFISHEWSVVVLFLLVPFTAVPYWRYISWRCPRCREPFFVDGWVGNALARSCIRCGLKLYSNPEDFERR